MANIIFMFELCYGILQETIFPYFYLIIFTTNLYAYIKCIASLLDTMIQI